VSGGGDELREEHEEHVNHEAWVIPYADLLTLLMAMFIALFAMSTVDASKFKAFALGFNEALGGGKLDSGIGGAGKATSPVVGAGNGEGVFTGTQLLTGADNGVQGSDIQKLLSQAAEVKNAKKQQQQTLEEVQHSIDSAARALGLGGKVQTKQLNNGLEVTVLTDQVLFTSGSATLETRADPLLDMIAEVLTRVDNPIIVQGHTDSAPIHTGQFPSNRYLSSARADAVVEYFIAHHIDSARLTSAGRGADVPIASNGDAAGRARNRRVEIIVQSKLVTTTLKQAGLDDGAAPPTTVARPANPTTGTVDPGVEPNLGAHGG
jgi:chemotaxis protein MotB